MLKTSGFNGPISLHSEYMDGDSFRKMNTEELLRQTAADRDYFEKEWGEA
jgi:hypothetical protein